MIKLRQPEITGTSKRKPLASGLMEEGPVLNGKPFSESELAIIKSRRAELITEGFTDRAIAKELSEELPGRTAKSNDLKIRKLVKSGKLPENPNRKEEKCFTEQEIQQIDSRRPELIKEGLTDRAIAQKISKEFSSRTLKSITSKIRKRVSSKELPGNPNKQSEFTEREIAIIKSRRAELIKEGFKDYKIARKLAEKLLGRTAGSIDSKIQKLIKSEQLPENPNHKWRKDFSKQDVSIIGSRRAELIKEGLTDLAITRKLAEELPGKKTMSIYARIRISVEAGDFPENPNKILDFTQDELSIIGSRRAELIKDGLSDAAIAQTLSNELAGWTMATIYAKIRRLINSGELPENPHKLGAELSREQHLANMGGLVEALDRFEVDGDA